MSSFEDPQVPNKITDLRLPAALMAEYGALLENRTVRKIIKNVSNVQAEYVLQAIRDKDECGTQVRMQGEIGHGKVKEVKEAFEELGFKVSSKKPDLNDKRAGFVTLSVLYKDHATEDRGF
ncbi:MAG TPA: hypothetical protein PLB38_03170 [bacterium]|nr:hypothetical protein [bacterium]